MNLVHNFTRIRRFLWHNRHELATPAFWQQVVRVVQARFRFWDRVSNNTFEDNLAVIENRPWNLHLELSNICNADCIFCAYQYQTREKTFMSDAIYSKALDEYCEMGGGDLMLEVTVGDPLMDAQFVKRTKEASSRPEIGHIETITNGIALHKHGVDEVVASGLTKMTISTAPWDEELYLKIYRTSKSKYGHMTRNIRALLESNAAAGCPIDICISFRGNLTKKETLALPDYQAIASLPHRVEFLTDYDNWTGEIRPEDLLKGMHMRPQSKLEKDPCFWLYDGPIVFVDGSVGLCGCRDYNANSELIVGNIKDEDLLTLWRSAKTARLRERFREGNAPSICQKCTTYCNLDFYRTGKGTERTTEVRSRYQRSLPVIQ